MCSGLPNVSRVSFLCPARQNESAAKHINQSGVAQIVNGHTTCQDTELRARRGADMSVLTEFGHSIRLFINISCHCVVRLALKHTGRTEPAQQTAWRMVCLDVTCQITSRCTLSKNLFSHGLTCVPRSGGGLDRTLTPETTTPAL